MIAGEWDDAIAELEAGFALAEEIGETYSRAYAHGVLSLISFHRNDLSRAGEAAIAAARDLAGWSPGYRTRWAAWPRALILEADGEPGQALATWPHMGPVRELRARAGIPGVGADLVRLALAAGDIERAREVSAAVTEVAARNEAPWMAGAALRCRGLVENDAEILQAAAGAYARGSRPLALALACEDAGAAFARRGQMDRARPLLDKAIGIYERLDAARDLARAEAVLREAGSGAAAGSAEAAAIRLGQSHPGRAQDRRPGRRGPVQSPDRPTPVRIRPDGADASRPRVCQARYHRAAQLAAEVSRHHKDQAEPIRQVPLRSKQRRVGALWRT